MQLEKYLKDFYPTAGPYEGINAIESRLLEHNYLVVIDEQKAFHGILTPVDLIKRPHKIVIDCITRKENISFNDTTFEVIEKFRKNQCGALPVIHNNNFVGIIEKKQILFDLEQKINELHQKSLISEKAKEYFLNNLSHEIRTPLNGIIGFIEVMTQYHKMQDVNNQSISDLVKTSTERFLLIMNDIVELSLLHAGDNIAVEKTDISVSDILFDLRDYFENLMQLQQKDIKLICSVSVPSIAIISDEKKVKHIMFHLIDNAIKFTSDNVVVFGYESSNTKGYVDLFVKNRFKGVFDKVYFKIFEKQEEIGRDLNSGLGIGLPLIKKLTELLGGSICVNNHNSEIEFRVTIPENCNL